MEKDKAPEWRRMKAQVEKDEGSEAEALPRLLIVVEGVLNHFLFKNQFTKLGYNSIEVNYKNELVIFYT